jgi:hypothetical protein
MKVQADKSILTGNMVAALTMVNGVVVTELP